MNIKDELGSVEVREKFRDKKARNCRTGYVARRLNAPSFLLNVTVNPYHGEESHMHVHNASR